MRAFFSCFIILFCLANGLYGQKESPDILDQETPAKINIDSVLNALKDGSKNNTIDFSLFENPQSNTINFSLVAKPKNNILESKVIKYPEAAERLNDNINSTYGERQPVISSDGHLYFTSKYHPGNIPDISKRVPYERFKDDIYVSYHQSDGQWSPAVNLGEPLNNDNHNFAIAISPNGQKLYIANVDEVNGRVKHNVSYSQRTGFEWSEPILMDIRDMYNLSSFSNYNISENEEIMLMAIKRKNTMGDRDLYVSFKKRNESWSKPHHLGKTVNTKGEEASVFLASDNKTIYFSSDGHPGYGGLDIFISHRLDDTWKNWSEPLNLGEKINSTGNEYDYTIPISGQYAYFSSDINSVNMMTDLYQIRLPEEIYLDLKNTSIIQKPIFGIPHCNSYAIDKEIEKGNYESANSLWDMCIPMEIKQLNDSYVFLSETERNSYLNTVNKVFDKYYSYTITHMSENNKQSAVDLSINSKALVLDHSISVTKFIKEIKDDFLSQLAEELNGVNDQIAGMEIMTREQFIKEVGIEVYAETCKKRDHLRNRIMGNEELRVKLNKKLIKWREIKNRLGRDEISIDFIRFHDQIDTSTYQYYAVLIDRDMNTPKFIRLGTERAISSLLQIDSKGYPKYLHKTSGNKILYQNIWQPLMPYLTNVKTIHLSPAGLLHKIPFESLRNQKGEYLLKRFKFHYYSSMRDFMQKKLQKRSYRNIVLLGDILYDLKDSLKYEREKELLVRRDDIRDKITALKGTLEEIKGIKDICERIGLYAILLTGSAAKEDTIYHFHSPDILHFSTHGVSLAPLNKLYNTAKGVKYRLQMATNPLQRSALMLYGANHHWVRVDSIIGTKEDGILTALEVTGLDLQNTNLVVLSACSTGLGDIHNTEGVFGLQRAFKIAGAKNVVASLWNVDDAATKDLMVLFYQNLLEKKQDVATALRNAKTQLREEGMEAEDWAGFILIE